MAWTAVYSLPLLVSRMTAGLPGSAATARNACSVGFSAVPSFEKSQPTSSTSKLLSRSRSPSASASVPDVDWTAAPCQPLTA